MFDSNFLRQALLGLPILLFSLTFHEFAHAWTAYRFGDPTAQRMGRMTLNPIVHIDLMGLLVMVLSQFRFGWAKPVPVNPSNFRDPRWGDLWVSAAGPISNLILALIAGVMFRLLVADVFTLPEVGIQVIYYAISINAALAFFNLIPLFPLDGSHILRNLLPPEADNTMDKIDQFAPFLLMGLVFLGLVWYIIGPFVKAVLFLFAGIQ